MKTYRSIVIAASVVVLSTIGIVAFAESSSQPTNKKHFSENPQLVKRGEYMVHNVVLCIDCHSPRGERGEFIEGRHLTGSVLGFAPSVPMPAWAPAAPPIAGMPAGWSEDALVQFLRTGERPYNLPSVRPPMPPYRLNQADAEAVAAYLHALGNSVQ